MSPPADGGICHAQSSPVTNDAGKEYQEGPHILQTRWKFLAVEVIKVASFQPQRCVGRQSETTICKRRCVQNSVAAVNTHCSTFLYWQSVHSGKGDRPVHSGICSVHVHKNIECVLRRVKKKKGLHSTVPIICMQGPHGKRDRHVTPSAADPDIHNATWPF
jgi:hypothetical protein